MILLKAFAFFTLLFVFVVLPAPLRLLAVTLPYDNTNPVIHTNDGNIDVYSLEYAMSLASAGDINLVGIVGELVAPFHYQDMVGKARRSGMVNIPDSVVMNRVAGATRALQEPASGLIEDTIPLTTLESNFIVSEANKATPENPLVIHTGGPLTAVADAYLLDNSIADKIIVTALLGRENDMVGLNGCWLPLDSHGDNS